MPTFKYHSLAAPDQQIRLLDLLPGSGRVKCRLRHESLSEIKRKYETVSYYWGEETDRRVEILVNDRIFPIRPNLHAALLRLRYLDDDRPRTLWVDAICIDQENDDEKSTQVSLMGKVYNLCWRVVIWIGEHDALTNYAFKAIKFMASRSASGEQFNYYDWKQIQRNEKPRFAWTPEGMISGAAINALFSRPWFRRVWIIQEVVLPPDAIVVCGKWDIGWDFIVGAQKISKTNFDVNDHLGTILRFRDWPERLADDILGYAIMASRQEATNPRDKIYGLLGIESIFHRNAPVTVNYKAEVSSIFLDFTTNYLEKTNNLQILAICRGCKGDNSSDTAYPSWAIEPEFSSKHEPLSSDLISWSFVKWSAYPRGFSAGGQIPGTLSLDGNLLRAQGFQFDTIMECSPVNNPGAARYKEYDVSRGGTCWRSLVSFCSIYLRGGFASWASAINFCQFYIAAKKTIQKVSLDEIYRPTGQATLDAFWQVIRGPHLPVDHPDADADARKQFEEFDKMLSSLARRAANSPLSIARITREILVNQACMQLFPLINITKHRRFFVTQRGYMGLGPRETAVGDTVIILQGHQAPILARSAPGRHWKVVGDSYIRGIMEGEEFAEEKCEPLLFE
ncbi:hypothetical protein SAMD00023353_2701660 [Rosellinia necatrix]|uniref:Heterokaryon incompatibility domain-containing protein n=1 Tax=Rosellinia necatrix TaxID=77044 RepID=A0A1W2TGM2_ROSNE|nr:hypothetical protein SAMD00023353_2701660 [Rosellinia necatrix]